MSTEGAGPDRAGGVRGLRIPAPFLLAFLVILARGGACAAQGPFERCPAPDTEKAWSRCYFEVASERGAWEEAAARLERHLALHPADPDLIFDLGRVRMSLNDSQTAARLFQRAADGFARRDDPRLEAYARLNLAECLRIGRRLQSVDAELARAETAARAAGEESLMRLARILRVRQARMQGGDLETALWLLRQMERELPHDGEYDAWKQYFYELGSLLRALGRYQEAWFSDSRWAAMAQDHGKPFDEATARANMAVSVCAMTPTSSRRQAGIRLAREALQIAQAARHRSAEIKAHRLLGKLLPAQEGRAHLRRCLELSESSRDSLEQSRCLFALAGNLVAGDPGRAQAKLEEALALAAAAEDPWTAVYGWADRLRVRWTTLPAADAAADSLALLAHVETLRRLQSSETGRAAFFTGWTGVYHSLAGFLLAVPGGPSREELETAFEVSERLRARLLLDSLADAGSPPPALPGALEEERAELLAGLVRVQRALQNPALGEAERGALLAELDALEQDLTALAAGVRVDHPAAFPARGFASLAETEGALAPNQALLSFLVAPEVDVYGRFAGGAWLLATSNAGTRVYRLPGRMELEIKIEMFVDLAQDRDGRELALGAAALYEDLLREALAGLPDAVDELIVVPDGVLHLLPFGLLQARMRPAAADRIRISEVPSATLWLRWRNQPSTPPRAALVLADPAFLSAVITPEGDDATDGAVALERRWALETGARLGRLPRAVDEGDAVVRHLGGPPNRKLSAEQASERFLKSGALADFGIVHFAAHALVDAGRPRRSAVLLAAGGPEEDGLLQPREIAGLDLTGKLVVLSACESGSGRVLQGEGVQSLARAFFQAGARTVVASLWRLRDGEAAAFFDRFYRMLSRGESVAGAVASAQRESRSAGAPPAAWAGVVVVGDGAMVPVPGGVPESRGRLSWVVVAAAFAGWLGWRIRIARRPTAAAALLP